MNQKSFMVDQLAVQIYTSRDEMGRAVAQDLSDHLQSLMESQDEVRIIFACAPSQDEFTAALSDPDGPASKIDWSKIVAFHMDDYVGLPGDHPESFRRYMQDHLLSNVSVKTFHGIESDAPDVKTECDRYEALLREKPIDVVCLGIGENGHIAFNDPPVADFNDPRLVKVIELDQDCRQQQVNDGCFPDLESVPPQAITLTVPAMTRCKRIFGIVPGVRKAESVLAALTGPISTVCPASILREHPNAKIYLEPDSARLVVEVLGEG